MRIYNFYGFAVDLVEAQFHFAAFGNGAQGSSWLFHLQEDVAGLPGATVFSQTFTASTTLLGYSIEFDPGEARLSPNTYYWLSMDGVSGSAMGFWSNAVAQAGNIQALDNGSGYASYGSNTPADLRLLGSAAAIPEPSTYAAVAGALALLATAYRTRRTA